MFKAKEIDGEWVVVDESGEIIESCDGKVAAHVTAAKMNRESREESHPESENKIHTGNYGKIKTSPVADELDESADETAREIPSALMNGKRMLPTSHGSKTEEGIHALITNTKKTPEERADVIMNGKKMIYTSWGSKTSAGIAAMIKRYNMFWSVNTKQAETDIAAKKLESNSSNALEEAIKLYNPDTDFSDMSDEQLHDYLMFMKEKLYSEKDATEQKRIIAALNRAEQAISEREEEELNEDASINLSTESQTPEERLVSIFRIQGWKVQNDFSLISDDDQYEMFVDNTEKVVIVKLDGEIVIGKFATYNKSNQDIQNIVYTMIKDFENLKSANDQSVTESLFDSINKVIFG